jgi:hypothetical protein
MWGALGVEVPGFQVFCQLILLDDHPVQCEYGLWISVNNPYALVSENAQLWNMRR